ncbi:uncharacterized protein TNCV_3863501 [Trichonephila clavipes]|uniref:Uncharacterized protein n=1 Tax=Trichonephila clavipes TaxID=2585209 RepID=A0A8X6S5D7_TRICX|nr:uncharacterized protein TNCV_3863501 [Trichonephila clavipes]
MIMKFEKTGDLGAEEKRNWLGLKPSKKSLLLWLKKPPVPYILQQVVDQCHAGWRFRGLLHKKICNTFLKWYPYKIHVMQTLKPQDHKTHLELACSFFSCEKSKNYHIWSTSPLNVLHQQPLHSDYLTTCCVFTAEFILGPFFFETLTPQGSKRCFVMSVRYSEFLQQQVIPALQTATAGSDVVQSGRPIFDDFFQHLWPYIIGNNTANVAFKMVKRLWLIRIDQ